MRSIANFFARFGVVLFFVFAGVAIIPLNSIVTEFNRPFIIAFEYLTLPVLGIWFFTGLKYKEVFLGRCKKAKNYWTSLIILPFVIILFSGSYVMLANAILPPQTPVVVAGTVLHKASSSGGRSVHNMVKTRSYVIDISTSKGVVKLNVIPSEYDKAIVGRPIEIRRIMGPLGFVYIWKSQPFDETKRQ